MKIYFREVSKLKCRFLIITIIILCLSLVLTASCGFSASAQTGKNETVNLDLVTGSSGGGWWTLGASLAEIVRRENPWISISVKPGQTFPNIINVQEKKVDMGLTFTAFVPMALKGEDTFKGRAATDIRAIATFAPTFLVTLVKSDLPIKSFKEIKEKQYPIKLAMHPPGSAPYFLSQPVLNAYGLNVEDILKWGGKIQTVASHPEAVDLIKDGHIDTWMMIAFLEHPNLTELLITREMRFLSLDPEVVDNLSKEFGFQPFTIPANSFKGQKDDVLTLGMYPVIFVNKDLSEEIVYAITKTLSEFKDELSMSAAEKKVMDPKVWWKSTVFPLHPGAEKYYKEKGWK